MVKSKVEDSHCLYEIKNHPEVFPILIFRIFIVFTVSNLNFIFMRTLSICFTPMIYLYNYIVDNTIIQQIFESDEILFFIYKFS